jgi:hypothetical protein
MNVLSIFPFPASVVKLRGNIWNSWRIGFRLFFRVTYVAPILMALPFLLHLGAKPGEFETIRVFSFLYASLRNTNKISYRFYINAYTIVPSSLVAKIHLLLQNSPTKWALLTGNGNTEKIR